MHFYGVNKVKFYERCSHKKPQIFTFFVHFLYVFSHSKAVLSRYVPSNESYKIPRSIFCAQFSLLFQKRILCHSFYKMVKKVLLHEN